MRKLYRVFNTEEDYSLEEAIEEFFKLTQEEKELLFLEDGGSNLFKYLGEAKDWYRHATALIIIEYSLSEDEVFQFLIDRELESKPTNIWYFWWDSENQKLKEILKAFI